MVVALVVVGVIILWGILGGIIFHTSGASSAPVTTGVRPGCEDCARLDAWFASLDFFGKIAAAAWFALQKLGCAIRGC